MAIATKRKEIWGVYFGEVKIGEARMQGWEHEDDRPWLAIDRVFRKMKANYYPKPKLTLFGEVMPTSPIQARRIEEPS